MGEILKDQLRGMIIQDPRITTDSLWAAHSTYTESDPAPGVPDAQGDYGLVLESSGSQSLGKKLRIKTITGGHPQPGGGGFVWKNDTDSLWRGHDTAGTLTDFEAVDWGSAGDNHDEPHAVTLDNGTILVAYHKYDVGINLHTVRVSAKAVGGAWVDQTIFSIGGLLADVAGPCLVTLPNGDIQIYHWVVSGNDAQIMQWTSTDNGQNWTETESACLKDPIDVSGSPGAGAAGFELKRIRASELNGQILLITELIANNTTPVFRHGYKQFASDAEGTQFELIESSDGSDIFGFFDVVTFGGQFHIHYLEGTSGLGRFKRLGTAYQRLSVADQHDTAIIAYNFAALDGTSKFYADGDLTVWADDAGSLYLAVRGMSSDDSIIYRSHNSGVTWASMSLHTPVSAIGVWLSAMNSGSSYPVQIAGTHQCGRSVIFSTWETVSTGAGDDSLVAHWLGGFSTITMPGSSTFKSDDDRAGWSKSWLAMDEPQDSGWSVFGAGSDTLGAAKMTISTTGANRGYQRTISGSPSDGVILRARFKMLSGGSTASLHAGVAIELGDGSDEWQIEARADFSPAEILIRDVHGAASIGTISVGSWVTQVDLLIAMKNRVVRTWWKNSSSGGAQDRVWTEGPSSTSLVSSGAAGSMRVTFGHPNSSTSSSEWYELHISGGDANGLGLTTAPPLPDDLFPRTFAGAGFAAYVDDGVKVTAVDGPARRNDEYHIDTRYGFPVERLWASESPSPRVKWRSTNTSQQDLALSFRDGTEESTPLNDTIGICLQGANFREWELAGYDIPTAAWVTLIDGDLAAGKTGLGWLRLGDTIVPNTATPGATFYLSPNELAGGFMKLGNDYRKIKTNTEGLWGGVTHKIPHIILEGITGAEATSGSGGFISVPNGAATVNLLGAAYSGYRLRINSQGGVDPYFEMGNMIIGPCLFFGQQYSWGRSIQTTANVELFTQLDGTSRTVQRGPSARAVQFAWTDGIDMTDAFSPDPDYIKNTTTAGALPVVSRWDTPYQMEGLIGLLDGPDTPIVYLPSVKKGPADVRQLLGRHEFMAGRLTSPVSIESVQGEEGLNEVWRIASITIDELV